MHSACCYHIRDIGRISTSSLLTLSERIAVGLVTGKLVYCNSLLHNIPEKDMSLKNYNVSKIIWLGHDPTLYSRPILILKSLDWQLKIYTLVFRYLTSIHYNQNAYQTFWCYLSHTEKLYVFMSIYLVKRLVM